MALINDFILTYPEFTPLFETDGSITPEGQTLFDTILNKVQCLYPEYQDLTQCINKYPLFMLIAHTLVMEGRAVSIGFKVPTGNKTSSSVGGVSVSYQVNNHYAEGDYNFYLSFTKYGREYLAFLDRNNCMVYVN